METFILRFSVCFLLFFSGSCFCSRTSAVNMTMSMNATRASSTTRNDTRGDNKDKMWAAEARFFLGNESAVESAGNTWCVAKNNADDKSLQTALDYACGIIGADCRAIQQGGPCFDPDNVQSHASYAFNNYYLKNAMAPGSCDFNGNALPTIQDPSHGKCVFPASSGTGIPSIYNVTGPGPEIYGPSSSQNSSSGTRYVNFQFLTIITSIAFFAFGIIRM